MPRVKTSDVAAPAASAAEKVRLFIMTYPPSMLKFAAMSGAAHGQRFLRCAMQNI
jgi:hypothetical protein